MFSGSLSRPSEPTSPVKNPCRKNSYGILLAANSLGNTLDPTAASTGAIITTWVFNPSSGRLVLTADVRTPQTVIGYDLHPCLDRAILGLRETATPGPCSTAAPGGALNPISTQTHPGQPFPDVVAGNLTPQPGSNLRLYAVDFNVFHNALKFLAGHYLGNRVSQVRFSNDGKLLAVTGRAVPLVTGGTGAVVSPPGILTVYTYNHNQDTIHLQDAKVTPPVPGSLAWDFSDSHLEVGGTPTPDQFAIDLYSVFSNQ